MTPSDIADLLRRRRPGHGLERAFYTEPEIYALELERIFARSWLYAGHGSEWPAAGDWRLLEIAGESLILARGEDGELRAFANVCRHRGSRVCLEPSGRSKRFTCPYHGWSYGLDGRLLAAAHLGREVDRAALGLKSVPCENLAGLVFVNLDPAAPSLRGAASELLERLAPYDLPNTRLAHRRAYPFEANWKLALENYSECYHCAPAHPEYARAHALADPATRYGAPREAVLAAAPRVGLDPREIEGSHRDAPAFGADLGFQHYALLRGHVTGSEDGRPLAPLLGSIGDYHGGCVDLQFGPCTFGLAYDDHLVLYAFRPLALDRSVCEVSWLVRGDAVEGEDYDRERLTWLWDVTTRADQRIVDANARGVASRFYEPGPLSEMEAFLGDFLDWYAEALVPAAARACASRRE